MGAARGAQSGLAAPAAGLPAGGGWEGLALGQEPVHFFFPGKLSQDGGVSQYTHVQRLLGLGGFFLRTVADYSVALG